MGPERPPFGRRAAPWLWLLVLLSLIPAALLALQRVRSEGRTRTVAVVMDEGALAEQANYLGVDVFELAARYRELGLPGIAVYEDTVETLAAKGRAAVVSGADLVALSAARGEPVPDVTPDATLVSALEPGALDALLAKTRPAPREVSHAGRRWFELPGRGQQALQRPAGPDREALERFADAGFDIAYRPRNYPNLAEVGADFPPQARYLIHAGLDVAGWPNALPELVAASRDHLTAIIEGTPQDGMAALRGKVPTTRLLSFNQDYINRRLRPDDLVDKYLLAANERNVRLLYLRPYTAEPMGDMAANTERLISELLRALERDGFTVAPLDEVAFDYRPAFALRALSAVGVLAGLALLALLFPGVWGPLAAAAVLALALAAGGADWDALALVAALVFPVIGFGHLPRRWWALPAASGVSLAGALLLAAVGSDRAAMMAIEPFAGVGATLVVPPALFLAAETLRWRRPAALVREWWGHEVRLGEVAVALVALAALALVFLRRGNFPVIGASEAELAVRALLSEWFVRPRFKELLGHPLALLALVGATWRWPAWAVAPLLAGGVVAQASILNSFSHYHTPLLVSLQRSVVALALGALLGLLLLPLAQWLVTLTRRWLARG